MWDKLNRYRDLFSSPSGYLDPEYESLQSYLQDVMGSEMAGNLLSQAMPGGMYASAAVDYGMDVNQVNQVLQRQMGINALTASPAEIRDVLGAYVQARGGSPPIGTSVTPWQMMHGSVGYHSAMGAAKHLGYQEEPPAGYVQYEDIAYPYERLSAGLGWTITPEGRLETGLAEGKTAKLAKRSRQMQQRESTWFSNVPVQQSSILAQGATVPEQIQRVQAFVSVAQDLPEGAGYFDPSLGRATSMIKRQYHLPESVDPTSFITPGSVISGREQLVAFAGHRGERFEQYEQLRVVNVDVRQTADKWGKPYSEMVLQMQATQPMGQVDIKNLGGKVSAVPMTGLRETLDADLWVSMNEPYQMASWIMGGMSQEELKGALGYAPERLTPGVAQEFYQKYMLPRMEQRWIPGRFRADDPRFLARQEAGTVRNVEDVGGGWMTAEQRLTGFSTPIGIQPRTVWGYHSQLLKPEVYAALKRMPEYEQLVSHYEQRGQRSVAETQHIGAAALANAGVATGFETVAAADVVKQMPTFTAQAIGMLREQGKIGPTDEPSPGLYSEALMEVVGKAYPGKGIQFGDLTLPNPETVLRSTGRGGIEGQIFGLSSAYADLMQAMEHAEGNPVRYAEAVARAQTAFLGDSTDNPGLVRGRGFRDEFWGLPTSGGLSGGRVTPMEDMPIDRFAMGREQMLNTLQTAGMSEYDAATMVEDMFSGQMKQGQLPRVLAFGYPLTAEEEQLSIRLGWAGPRELGMTEEAYETAFGSSVGMHPVVGAALGRDFDRDPYAFLQGTLYGERKEGGWWARQMAGDVTPPEEIIRMAQTRTPAELGPDIEKIRETGSYYETMRGLRGAGSTIPREEAIGAFNEYSTGKAGMAPAYQFGLRTLKWALGGDDPVSRQARNELGIPYGKAQDIEGAGPAWTRLQDYYRSLGLAKWGARGEEGGIYAKGPSHLLRDVFEKTAALTDFSPETRAAMLMYPEREGFEKMPGLIERYNALTGEGKGIEAAGVMGEMFETAAYGGDLWKWAKEGSPLGYSIMGMAARRTSGKEGMTWTTPGGKQMSFQPTGKLAENLTQMAEQGGAVRGIMDLFKKGDAGNIPFHEAVQSVRHAEAVGARIDPSLMGILSGRVGDLGVPSPAEEAQVDRSLGALDFSGAGDPLATAKAIDEAPKFAVESVSPTTSAVELTPAQQRQADALRKVLQTGALTPERRQQLEAQLAGLGGGGTTPPPTTPAAPAAPAGGDGGQGGGGQQGPGGIQLPKPMEAAMMAASGAMQGFKGSVRFGQDATTGQAWTQMNINPPQEELTALQRGIIDKLKEYEPKLKDLVESTGEMSKQYKSSVKILGQWHQQLRQAMATPAVEGSELARMQGTGKIEEGINTIEKAFGGRGGLEKALADVEIGQDVATMFPADQSPLQKLFGGVKHLAFGWAPMQMSRAWNLAGGKVFGEYIPAAAQAEMAGWGLTQAIGGAETGLPEGVAGGMMQYAAARRQALIEGGRAGYRAWGAGTPMLEGLTTGVGIAGPAISAGLVAGIGLNAVGNMAMFGTTAEALAGPVGAAIAIGGTLIGAEQYARSFATDTAENALQIGQSPWTQALAFAGRVADTSDLQGWERLVAGPARLVRAIGAIPEAFQWSQEQAEVGRGLTTTTLSQMTGQQRMASLNWAAQQLQGQQGTVWSGMDEGQVLQALTGFAPYVRGFEQMTPEQMASGLPEWMQRAVSMSVSPARYAQLSQAMGMGQGGAEAITQMMVAPSVGAYEQMGMESALNRYAGLSRFGVSGQEIVANVAGGQWGGLTGQANVNLQRVLSGSQSMWSQYARQGLAPAWAATQDQYGFTAGTLDFSGLNVATGALTGNVGALTRQIAAPAALMSSVGGTVNLMGGRTAQLDYGGLWGLQQWGREEGRAYEDWQQQQQLSSLASARSYQYGTWGIQDQMRDEGRAYQRANFGIQGRRLDLQEVQSGIQFGWQATDIETGFERGMIQLGWSQEQSAKDFRHQLTRLGWQEQDVQRQFGRQLTQFQWQEHEMGVQWGRQQTQWEWAEADFDRSRAVNQLQFGWQMEDFDESIRFATGRQRKQLLKQRQRAVTTQNIEEEGQDIELDRMKERQLWAAEDHQTARMQMEERRDWATEDHGTQLDRIEEQRKWLDENQDTQEDYYEQKKKWLEEDYEKDKDRLAQRREWAEEELGLSREQHGLSVQHFEDEAKLQDKLTGIQRAYWEEQHQRQLEAIQKAGEHRAITRDIEDITDRAVKNQQLLVNNWAKAFEEGGPLYKAIINLADALNDYAGMQVR